MRPLFEDDEKPPLEPKSRFPRITAARERIAYFLQNNPLVLILLLPVVFAGFYVCYYLILYLLFHHG